MAVVKGYRKRVPPTPPQTPRKKVRISDAFPGYARQIRAASDAARAIANPTPSNIARAAVSVGTQAYRAMTSRHSQTRLKNGYRASDTKYTSGGKFVRRKKSDPFALYSRKGLTVATEYGCVVAQTTNYFPLFVGHSTVGEIDTFRRMYYRCLIRDLYSKHGIHITSLEFESPGTGNVKISYQLDADAAAVVVNFPTAGKSYEQLVSDIRGVFDPILGGVGTVVDYFQMNEILLDNGSITLAKIDLKNCRLNIFVKSDLKIQNRTIAAGADEDANSTENIANQPLYGKSYSGKGQGMILKGTQGGASNAKSLLCSNNSGLLAYAPPVGVYWLREPPLPSSFEPKPLYHKASVEPGQIKTSSLTSKFSVKQVDFWRQFVYGPSTAAKGKAIGGNFGKFHIFALEKMMTVSATDTVPTIGLEKSARYGMFLTYPRPTTMLEIQNDWSVVAPVVI